MTLSIGWACVAGLAAAAAWRLGIRASRAGVALRTRALRGPAAPAWLRGRIGAWFASADLPVTPERWVRTTGLLALGAGTPASVVRPWLGVLVVVGVLGARAAMLGHRVRGHDARRARAVPGLLESVAADLRTGVSLLDALRAQPDRAVPGHELLAELLDRVALGVPLGVAATTWTANGPGSDVAAVGTAVRIAAERGGNAAPAFERLAVAIRERHHTLDTVLVQTSQARLSALVEAAAPVGFLGFTLLTDARAAGTFLTTAAGRWCLGLGMLCNALAAVAIAHILRDPVRHRPRRAAARARQRALLLGREVPQCADLIGLALGSGATAYEAVEVVATTGPPLSAAAFRTVVEALGLGASLAQSLGSLADTDPVLAPVARACLAASHGAPTGELVARLADDARRAVRHDGELRARRVPVLLLFPLVFLVLPAFVLLSVAPALISGLASL